MRIGYGLYLINSLVRAFERTIARVMGVMDSLGVVHGPRIVVELALQFLKSIDRLLELAKRYLERVRMTMRYRLYFEAVTGPMRKRYRQLKRLQQ